ANGAGKTTLVHILLGSSNKDEGTIYYKDQVIQSPYSTKIKRKFGFIQDEPLYIEYLSAIENLQYFCAIYNKKIPRKELESQLASYGLDGKDPKLVKYFSRGMKQKLSLCFIDIINPELIVMDEPTIGLDIVSIDFLKSNILAYSQAEKSLLITTHDIAFCKAIADEIYILHNGTTKKMKNKNNLLNELDLSNAILAEINESG
ncbi:ABC transporter ATP-binding protein, partial [Bacillaceae bacterium Marseille-Q3522]|nr:ABC transporter ATP-binding protein [Bacillaceae bacterium Marseille-Q3522]